MASFQEGRNGAEKGKVEIYCWGQEKINSFRLKKRGGWHWSNKVEKCCKKGKKNLCSQKGFAKTSEQCWIAERVGVLGGQGTE